MKKLVILLASLASAACVTGYNPDYRFNEVQVVNLSGQTIRGVGVRIVDTAKIVACEEVAKNALCQQRFGARNYPQVGIELSWTHADSSRRAETLNPDIPAYYSAAFPLRIVMEIDSDGSVEAFYEQEEPGRDGGSFFDL